MAHISETQTGNVTAHLEKLSGESADRNAELEQQIIIQNTDIGDIMQMLRNLTQKQGWCQQLSRGM